MLLGDTHGNTRFILDHVIPAAKAEKVEWIYQVGDFGYWEHTQEGKQFIDDVSLALNRHGLQLVFIQGNHDKVSMISHRYSSLAGFFILRPGLWFAPNGTRWEIAGKSFLALGGAYSIDKEERLIQEKASAYNKYLKRRQYSDLDDKLLLQLAEIDTAQTLWFPEEEMTEEQFEDILGKLNIGDVDVILAHDKPLASNPMMKLYPIAECIPNQRRLQKAVNKLQPKLFVHGHLHARYTDTIRCGDDDSYTRVEGLGADVPNFSQITASWVPSDAWEILDLEG